MEKVTIRDIAEAAGVSTSTVSRIINGKGKYSQETKQTVWNAISSMGYSPNLIAQTLRSNTNPLVGIILPEGSSEYFSRLVNLLIHDMIRDGLIPMVCVTFHDENIEQAYCRTLSALNAGAISRDVRVYRLRTGLNAVEAPTLSPAGLPHAHTAILR